VAVNDGPAQTQAANLKSPEAAGGWKEEIKPKFPMPAWMRSLKTVKALKIAPIQQFLAAKAFALARWTLAALSNSTRRPS
jgi:hypothetical protein